MLGPIIDELSTDNAGKDVTIAKINVEENQELAIKYGVRGIPTVLCQNYLIETMRRTNKKSWCWFQIRIPNNH